MRALFEALEIGWPKISAISEVCEQLGLSWSAISGLRESTFARGWQRRDQALPDSIGIDATVFRRRH